jgi:methyl-accepting chemotaxis protein
MSLQPAVQIFASDKRGSGAACIVSCAGVIPMNRLSIRMLLLGAMAMLLLVSSLQGLIGYTSVRTLVAQDQKIATDMLPSIKALSDVRYDMMLYRLRIARLVGAKDEQRDAVFKTTVEALANLNKDLATYRSLATTPDEQKALKTFNDMWSQYLVLEKEAIASVMKGDRDQASAILNEKALPFAQKAQLAVQGAVDLNAKDADEAVQASDASATISATLNLAMLGLGLIIGIAAMVLVRSRVVSPMGSITAAMQTLASGDLSLVVPHAERRDEIGAMAGAVQVFKDNALRIRTMEAEERRLAAERARRAENMVEVVTEVGEVVRRAASGDFSARLQIASDDDQMRQLVDGINEINRVVDEATGEFAKVLGDIARGDLTQTIATAYRGRFGELKDALNGTVERLSETVSTIQTTAVDVGSAAREINSGASDLSSRTEQQASSLEETAATAEELAASVKVSAQSARQAVELTRQAMGVATDGGAIVRDAVEAMARIEQASQKISDITGVIDEIAFQTNLLALNAAVEAARAGDAGKGFAVVASEVRTLAQRSSEAAKDITGLISASGAEVAQGVKLVRGAGDALEKIVDASRRVSETVSEISDASGEQANGIDELTQAVAHMDQMTQQNAALAEESAASATALSDQIERLNELAAAFRTRGGTFNVAAPGGAAPRMAARAAPAAAPKASTPHQPARLRQLAAEAFSGRGQGGGAPAPAPRKAAAGRGWEEF